MADQVWKLKENAKLDAEEVAKIACALKSLSVYTSIVCEEEDNPEELQQVVQEGLDAIENIFET